MSKKLDRIISVIPQVVLLLGVVVAVTGASLYHQSKKSKAVAIAPTLKERQFAVEEAKKQGKKEYSFETNFTPGVGTIADPQAYKDSWAKQNGISNLN